MSQQTERVTADTPATAGPTTTSTTAAPDTVRRSPSSATAPAQPAPVLTVGHAEDPMERQADAMADRVVAQLDASEPHRHSPGCGHLRRSVAPGAAPATVGLEGGDLDAGATDAIESARGGGRALPTDVRRRMEGAFGTSLSHVRVHDGPQAAKLSSAMQASAFTTGKDVFFGAGQFAPGTPGGEHVLAHELAHVVTEGSAGVRRLVIRRGLFDKVKAAKAKLFGSKEETDDAKAVKNSKKVEKEELGHHQEERARGNTQRAKNVESIYGADPSVKPGTQAQQDDQDLRLKDIGTRFEATLQAERDKFAKLKLKYKGSKSDEEVAKEAYDEIWLKASEDLRAVRPARETAAERLVQQARQVQSGAQAQQDSVDSVANATKLGAMLSKTVEGAYEVMVIEARKLMDTKPAKGKKAMSESKARKQVRELGVKHCEEQAKVRKHKTPRELPAEASKIDDAAWASAKERVDLREVKKKQDETAIERLQAQLAPTEDAKERQKDTDDVAGGKKVELGTGIVSGIGKAASGGSEQVAGAPGKLAKVKAFFTGKKAPEAPKRDDFDTPRDMFEQVTDGVTASGNLLTKLAGSVSEALSMARFIKSALKSKDPWDAVKATKAGLGSVDGLVNGATETAKLARSIQPSLSQNIAGVIPGLGVATSVIATSRAILDVAMAGRRQHETNTTLYDARARTSGQEADVLVWPLMKMAQAHTKSLENNVWALGKSVFDMVVAIGELGSAGGAGVPKALQTGGMVVDKIHDLGHFIADEVLTWQAKRAKKLSSVMHLEGAAQDELRMHPKMAVDAIIVRAVQGDDKALGYVCNYWVDGKQVTPELVKRIKPPSSAPAQKDTGKVVDPKDIDKQDTGRDSDDIVLIKIRDAILSEMNTEGDPKSVFDKLRAGVASAKGVFGLREKWAKTGEMAQTRNAHSGDSDFAHTKRDDRGFGWRLKMMLKGEEKFGRSTAKTQVLKDADNAEQAKAKKASVRKRRELPEGIACAIGPHKLSVGSTEAEAKAMFAKATDAELDRELVRTPPRNADGWLELMREEQARRKAEAAKAKAAKKKQKPSDNSGGKSTPTSSDKGKSAPTPAKTTS